MFMRVTLFATDSFNLTYHAMCNNIKEPCFCIVCTYANLKLMFSCHFHYSVWLNTASSFATWSAMFVVLLLMRGEPWSCWRCQRTRGLWSSSRRGWGQFGDADVRVRAVFVDAFRLRLLRVCWIFTVLSLVVQAAAFVGSSFCLKDLNIEKNSTKGLTLCLKSVLSWWLKCSQF